MAVLPVSDRRPTNPWPTFGVASVAQFMVILDASITNVALPSIGRGLHVSQSDLQWVVNIYVLMFGGFLLLGGRAGDLFGRRRTFVGGLVLFSLASLSGGLAQSLGWLVAARGIQGLGAAIIAPVSLAIVSSTFPQGAERNRALGIFGALAGIGGAAGVLLGGILTTSFGWQWVLYVNVPVGLLAAGAALRIIAPDILTRRGEGLDLPGAVTITGGLVFLVYAVVKVPENGWESAATIGFLAAAAVLLAAFVAIERRTAHPIVRLGIFRVRHLAVANLAGTLSGAGMFAMFFFTSLYMQLVLHYSALEAGLRYLPLALTITVAAAVTAQMVNRFGYKYVMTAGMLLVGGGLLLLTRVGLHDSYGSEILPAMLVFSAGMGMTFVPRQIACVTGVSMEEIGLASGLSNASLQIGGAIGLAVLSTVATSETASVMSAVHVPALALIDGFHQAFAGGAILLGIGALLVLAGLPQGGRVEMPVPAPVPALDLLPDDAA